MNVDPISLEQSIVFLVIVLLVATAYDIVVLRRARKAQCEDVAEICPSCDRITYGFNGDFKWCCYCGDRLPGDYIRIIPPKIIPNQREFDREETPQ